MPRGGGGGERWWGGANIPAAVFLSSNRTPGPPSTKGGRPGTRRARLFLRRSPYGQLGVK